MSSSGDSETREIRTDYLARVEGEGAMKVRVRGTEIEEVEFRIFEPPRFFEALLRGRQLGEAPDITARICGICPMAYITSACNAMEAACGVAVPDDVRLLRRLAYCGEWIESHVLHTAMLHAPDFLGYDGAVEMARDHRDLVATALRLKKAGNTLMEVIGGRAVHPVNFRVGGFYRAPDTAELRDLLEELEWALEAAVGFTRWVDGFDFPDYERDYAFVSLHQPGEYPIERGRLVSSTGLDIEVSQVEEWFEEHHVARSNALHSTMRGVGSYLVGPLARYALNGHELTPIARELADECGLGPVCRNPFRSIVVRAVETVFALEEAIRLIEAYRPFDPPSVEVVPRTATSTGYGASEAPRGVCWHRYTVDAAGAILDARIVPPTSQNQKSIEDDLVGLVRRELHRPDAELANLCEQSIRNYDPCISCATHFLRFELERL